MSNRDLIPFRQALTWIAASVVVVAGLAVMGWLYYGLVQERRKADPSYRLFAIVQTGPEKEALKTAYLAELLGLSVDQPSHVYAFDCSAARRQLLAAPMIKSAHVSTFVPGTVYIDYTIRKPVAYLRDYSNTAIDSEGVLIPCDPFFTPKRLPEIYLGLPALDKVWGTQVRDPRLDLALQLRDTWEKLALDDTINLKQIDLSRVDASSFGQRQIIVRLEERIGQGVLPVTLRIGLGHYEQALADYWVLRDTLRQQMLHTDVTIDMRIPQLAYISTI